MGDATVALADVERALAAIQWDVYRTFLDYSKTVSALNGCGLYL